MHETKLLLNKATGRGGGTYLKGSSNMFWNVTAIGNNAQFGGAFFSPGSTLRIWNSTIHNNTAKELGGAIFADTTTVILDNSTVYWNRSTSGNTGPAVFLKGSTLVFTNVTTSDNFADLVRQDVVCIDSSPNIYEGDIPLPKFVIPIIVCLKQCESLVVFSNQTQIHTCYVP